MPFNLWRAVRPREAYLPLTHAEVDAAVREHAYFLWIDAGRPGDRDPNEFWQEAKQQFDEAEFYHFKSRNRVFVYRKDGAANIKDALSFLKDWVTALVQIETGALAAFGLAAGFSGVFTTPSGNALPPSLSVLSKIFVSLELLLILLSGFSLLVSMGFGLTLLNALPGAMQRVPASTAARQADIFAISNEAWHWSLFTMADRFRRWFYQGVILFALFALVRISEQFCRTVWG